MSGPRAAAGPLVFLLAALFLLPGAAGAQGRERPRAWLDHGHEDPPPLSHPLGARWRYGAEVQIDVLAERNFDLDAAEPDDEATLEPRLTLGLAHVPEGRLAFYGELELSHGVFLRREDDGDRGSRSRARLRQAYLALGGAEPGLRLKVGRQRFREARDWWYDEELDAARVQYRSGRLALEGSASRSALVNGDLLGRAREQDATNLIGVARYAYAEDAELAGFLVAQERRLADEKPLFLGLRSIGRLAERLEHWLDVAVVRGTDRGRDLRAAGLDAGLEYRFDAPLRPSAIAGLAWGSGDADAEDGVDREFRQTGLQSSYFYYGEVLAPELSNLLVCTAGVKLRPSRDFSVRILYHRYRQHRAAEELRDVLIERDPDGESRELGQAIDLVVSWSPERRTWVDFVIGSFFPGRAFGADAQRAWFGQVLLTYELW